FERLEYTGRFPSHIVGEKVRTLEPDQFAAAEKRERLQSSDGGTNGVGRAVYIVRRAINDFETKFACFRRRQFLGQFRRFPFYPGLIGTDDRVNIGGRRFGFGSRHLLTFTVAAL